MDFEKFKEDMKLKYLERNPVRATGDLDSMDMQYKLQKRGENNIELICEMIEEYDKRKQE